VTAGSPARGDRSIFVPGSGATIARPATVRRFRGKTTMNLEAHAARHRGRRMRLALVLLIVPLALAFVPGRGAADVNWTGFVGRYSKNKDYFAGAGLRFSLARFTANPNVEYVWIDNGTSYSVNFDLTRNILPLGPLTGWIGAGLGFYTVNPDAGETNTDTGANLIAGIGLQATRYRPFAQFKWVVMEGDDPTAFLIGVRF
jgi:hypothetical protein